MLEEQKQTASIVDRYKARLEREESRVKGLGEENKLLRRELEQKSQSQQFDDLSKMLKKQRLK